MLNSAFLGYNVFLGCLKFTLSRWFPQNLLIMVHHSYLALVPSPHKTGKPGQIYSRSELSTLRMLLPYEFP